MSVTDPIADMLTIVRNGVRAHKESVIVKRSIINEKILEILKKEDFILNHKTVEDKKQGLIKIYLRYEDNQNPSITGLERISKPGFRVYKKREAIKMVYGGIGIAIISTPKGLMTDKEAREKKLGGEVLCRAW